MREGMLHATSVGYDSVGGFQALGEDVDYACRDRFARDRRPRR
jgi:hypothetical protein